LESSISSAAAKEKEGGKKMNASNAKALNGMKQKVRKTLREYETAVESYKKVSGYLAWFFFLPSLYI
jgi:translation initiation factor 3 subunit C